MKGKLNISDPLHNNPSHNRGVVWSIKLHKWPWSPAQQLHNFQRRLYFERCPVILATVRCAPPCIYVLLESVRSVLHAGVMQHAVVSAYLRVSMGATECIDCVCGIYVWRAHVCTFVCSYKPPLSPSPLVKNLHVLEWFLKNLKHSSKSKAAQYLHCLGWVTRNYCHFH